MNEEVECSSLEMNKGVNIRVKVLFFAKARELAGLKESELILPICISSVELKERVIKDFQLESIEDIVILALNEVFIEPDIELNLTEKDEIAVIPPISGGKSCLLIQEFKDKMAGVKDTVRLESSKLKINDIIESVISPNCGAVSSFIGTTRDNFEQKKVVKLEYEAYEPMAIKEMQTVCNKIRSQWDVEKIAIFHRLGEVPVMEASIIIAISSPHRQESLQAVQFAIDAVKTSVPIWKKEIYEKDPPEWKENKECSWAKSEEFNMEKKDDHFQTDNSCISVDNINVDFDNIVETVEVECESASGCNSSDLDDFKINPDEIQIKADTKELNRRIESFISRKREQVNLVNMQEFCTNSGEIEDENDESTFVCARVNAILMRRKDSNSHIKVHRVYNQWSHQNIKPAAPMSSADKTNSYPSALEERLSTTEKLLGINKPVPRDVYERIKKIEDRLLFLESISPEYKDLWSIDDCDSEKSFDGKYDDNIGSKHETKPFRKRTYSSAELDSKMNDLEDRYRKKAR